VIEAVNALRLTYGLAPLSVHSVLTEVAQLQANALAASEGAVGHTRPNGITLGQQLILLGYPLSGDLTLDGYRSENWVAASTVDEAISFWLSDDLHTNTMLSQNRSDIGAGVAVGDQTYVVIDTALRTRSGLQQSEAYDILTQIANSGNSSQVGAAGLISEYIIPVHRSTARPDGDVFHKVQYGQTLWSIAVTYGTTINSIRAWNNLGEEITIYEGQALLVQRSATQPPPATATSISSPTLTITTTATQEILAAGFPTMTMRPPGTTPARIETPAAAPSPGLWAGILVILAVIGGFAGAWFIRPAK
jgi:LysM repeat protein